MSALYPPIEPCASGAPDVGDGQSLYWETCGNPDGKPVVVLPSSERVIVNQAGRDARDPGMFESVIAATDKFAGPGVLRAFYSN